MVEDYWAARERDELARDVEAIGYPTDERLYAERRPLVTFRRWIEQLAGTGAYSRTGGEPE